MAGRSGSASGCGMGYVAQEAPSGETTPLEVVLQADVERSRLLAEAEDETIGA